MNKNSSTIHTFQYDTPSLLANILLEILAWSRFFILLPGIGLVISLTMTKDQLWPLWISIGLAFLWLMTIAKAIFNMRTRIDIQSNTITVTKGSDSDRKAFTHITVADRTITLFHMLSVWPQPVIQIPIPDDEPHERNEAYFINCYGFSMAEAQRLRTFINALNVRQESAAQIFYSKEPLYDFQFATAEKIRRRRKGMLLGSKILLLALLMLGLSYWFIPHKENMLTICAFMVAFFTSIILLFNGLIYWRLNQSPFAVRTYQDKLVVQTKAGEQIFHKSEMKACEAHLGPIKLEGEEGGAGRLEIKFKEKRRAKCYPFLLDSKAEKSEFDAMRNALEGYLAADSFPRFESGIF